LCLVFCLRAAWSQLREIRNSRDCRFLVLLSNETSKTLCYSSIEYVIIICSYGLWLSNKMIHQSKPRLQVTNTRDNIMNLLLNICFALCCSYILFTSRTIYLIVCDKFHVILQGIYILLQKINRVSLKSRPTWFRPVNCLLS
jgi:hypothetical protein